MEKPISVIMSVYNEKEDYLRQSIESVLVQTFPDFEFIIMNDGPEFPEVQKILDEYSVRDNRIRLHTNEANLGLTRSLNKALDLAKGKYVARLDSDDLAHPDRFKYQFEFMEAHPDHTLCGSWADLLDEEGNKIGEKKSAAEYQKIKKMLLFYNFFTHSSFFFRKDVILDCGGYTQDLKKSQDYDLILKLSARHPVAIIPAFLCSHRIHRQSISARSKKRQEWSALIARWNAIIHYGYPKSDFWKLLPALFYFLFIPHSLEGKVLEFLQQNTKLFLLREFFKSFTFSNKKRIGFVLSVLPTPYYGHIMASTRLRVYDVINAFVNSPMYFLELYKPWKKYDIVIFQKIFDEQALRRANKLKHRGTKIILDINVNYYDSTILGVLKQDESINHPKILKFTEIADGVITSTEYIQAYAKRIFPNKMLVCIPENITDPFFSVQKQVKTKGPYTLLYVGYAVKAPEILELQSILRRLRQQFQFNLLVICERDPHLSLPGIEVIYRPYQQKTIHQDMLEGDIFIAPRDLTQSYNLGHSFTKIGYPMAVGIPAIASAVPSYEESPAILCRSESDWYNNLNLLLKDANRRQAISQAGITYCREHFSEATIRKQYEDFFQTILPLP